MNPGLLWNRHSSTTFEEGGLEIKNVTESGEFGNAEATLISMKRRPPGSFESRTKYGYVEWHLTDAIVGQVS